MTVPGSSIQFASEFLGEVTGAQTRGQRLGFGDYTVLAYSTSQNMLPEGAPSDLPANLGGPGTFLPFSRAPMTAEKH
ncbi:MAG: hypothetical protein ACFB21_04630 [Opitutales bacterium]